MHDARVDHRAAEFDRFRFGILGASDRLLLGWCGSERYRSRGVLAGACATTAPTRSGGTLRFTDHRSALGAVLFEISFKLFQRLAVGALAEAIDRLPVSTPQDDLFAHVRARLLGTRHEDGAYQHTRQGQLPEWAHGPTWAAVERRNSHRLTTQRYQCLRRSMRAEISRLDSAWEKPRAQASWLNASTSLAPAPPSLLRSAGSPASCARARARAPLSPAGTIRPLSPSRTRPPAAAPTASVAMIASAWFMASLTTNPQGSRKVRVGMEGTTSTSHAPYTSRSCPGSSLPKQTTGAPLAGGAPLARGSMPARTSAAVVALSSAACQAAKSTGRPFSSAARPTNRKRTSASMGQRGSMGRASAEERQKSLSTACGATCTLRAPRALT